MATTQDYIEDLKRKGMIRPDGTKPPTLPPPAYYAQPYIPEQMSPEQWRDLVLENFRTVYLDWWFNAFQALQGVNPQVMSNTVIPVYDPDSGHWGTQVVPIAGS